MVSCVEGDDKDDLTLEEHYGIEETYGRVKPWQVVVV
jgi:hypothetical protein